jgi:hypothetical protein
MVSGPSLEAVSPAAGPEAAATPGGRAVYLAPPDGLCGNAARESATTGPFGLPLGGEPAQSSRAVQEEKFCMACPRRRLVAPAFARAFELAVSSTGSARRCSPPGEQSC